MMDAPQAQSSSEVKPVALTNSPDVTAIWGGFLAGLFNWYVLIKTIMIYRSELWLSVKSYSRCGWRTPYTEDQIWFVTPMWIGIGFILWVRVRSVAPTWADFAKWPIRFAFLGWVSVVLAGIGATLLSMTPPFLHRV